ncbi:MAG: hypothetical protein K2O32_09335 [Acetatifactor sp.]|nr:hypothetical protein [Acetatifactor sp.]
MAMEISNNYSNYASSYANAANSKKQTTSGKAVTQPGSIGEAGLSQKAQALLEKLRKTYGNMDFMVADSDKGDDVKEILSRGTKEVSVVFSGSELEKMASDKKYEQEYMGRVQGALRMSEQINREFGFTSAFGGKAGNGEISKIGISFNSDGTTSFFAELEKCSARQRARIEKTREDTGMKRTTVQAGSMEELLEKIRGVNWHSIKAENRSQSGGRFDFTI